jgi:transcriptional regulator with AAA-type ATPase domain/ribonuclease BN (tRNA processing enzyme)
MSKRTTTTFDRDRSRSTDDTQSLGWGSTADDIDRRIREFEERREQIDKRIEDLRRLKAARKNAFESCCREAQEISKRMDEWKPLLSPNPFPNAPLSVLFLGAVSGEWAAQSRYRGTLPGFGGFLVVADGLKIVVDPGRSTLGHLHAAEIHPRELDYLIATHSHWDCVRDLPTVINAATHTNMTSAHSGPPRLRLLATSSVLRGRLMDVKAIIEDELFPAHAQVAVARQRLSELPTMNAPAVHAFDLFVRLGGQFATLEIDKRYELSQQVEIRTRPSHHLDARGVPEIPGLDILVQKDGERKARCVYLSDTEYRAELADSYAKDNLGPIDILICNVKTLDIHPHSDGAYAGYSRRHLGWKGLLQLTRDFQRRGLLTPQSIVVLRAWGIETVTRLNSTDGVMTATPEKLRVYEETYTSLTQQPAVVPGQTWVAAAETPGAATHVKHIHRPFPPAGAFQRFGNMRYRSEAIAEVVRAVRPVAENPSEVLLITGETGTGKDALAESLHTESGRTGEIVRVNAQALDGPMGWETLVGHTKGAYTDAVNDRKGLLTQAANGTMVVEEAADMPSPMMVQFLTLLGTRKYAPIGETKEQPVTAQIIMTTSKDIVGLQESGRFPREFLCRVQRDVHLPPLRERREDIRAIVYGWQSGLSSEQIPLDEEALELLERHDWPGNVRSVENVLTRLAHGNDWSIARVRQEIKDEDRRVRNGRGHNAAVAALEPEEREVLETMAPAKPLARREIEAMLSGKKKGMIVRCLNSLFDKGLVRKTGAGPNTRYERLG